MNARALATGFVALLVAVHSSRLVAQSASTGSAAEDSVRMVEMARNEKDLELKRRIVSELALMNDKAATDYMMELLK